MKKILTFTLTFCIALNFALVSSIGAFADDKSKEIDTDKLLTEFDKSLLSDYDYTKLKNKEITLNVCNWGEYMAVNDDEYLDVNKAFEKLTGINVNYKTFATNEELYSKVKSGAGDYDVIFPSDYMISKMIKENLLKKLNFNNITNVQYIDSTFNKPVYDPSGEYSIPYLWGIVVLIYNKNMINGEVTGYESLWSEENKKNILMFNNPRDAFGIALTYLGYSQNTEDKKELDEAAALLKNQKSVVQAYVMDEIFDKMEGGSAAIAPYYAGDALVMLDECEDLDYCLPKEGSNRFTDAACILDTSKNTEAAEMYINFLNEVQIAYLNSDYVGYSTPHIGAYNLLTDEEKDNPLRCPPTDYLENKTEFFINLSDETNAYTQKLWNDIKVASTGSPIAIPVFLVVSVGIIIGLNVWRYRRKKRDIF